MNDLIPYIIYNHMSVMEAIRVINQNGKKIAFLCEEGILKGTLTDGDIRRYILKNGSMEEKVTKIVNYNPIFIKEDEIVNYKKFMLDHTILAIPIVDENFRIKRIEFLYSNKNESLFEKLEIPVVIMAGGKGTRLKPYTDILPKPLIPIGEKTITEHIIDNFVKNSCDDFKIIVNYKKELIKAYFAENDDKKLKLEFIDELEYLGTGGGLKLVKDKIKQTFFLTNCDILIDGSYFEMLRYHRINRNIITMICAKKRVTIPYGTIETGENGQIVSLKEKPETWVNVNTGMYIMEPEFLDKIPDNQFIHITDLIDLCIKEKQNVGAYIIDEDLWMDMGQLEEYEKMKKKLGIE